MLMHMVPFVYFIYFQIFNNYDFFMFRKLQQRGMITFYFILYLFMYTTDTSNVMYFLYIQF